MAVGDSREATRDALLTAVASFVSLVAAETVGLKHANLAVWTTFLVMAQFTFTSFQKGLERVAGRGVGILAGLVLATWFNEVPLVALGLIAILLTGGFYLYFAGRLVYTFLNAGLYLVAVFHIGHSDPSSAVGVAEDLFAAVVIGVLAADLVNWIFGTETVAAIQVGEASLWPVRADWLSQSLMLAVTVLLTLMGASSIGLPPEPAAISVILLTVSPHLQALIWKGELRIAGLLLAVAWSLLTFVLVGLMPYFLLLAGLICLGQFIAVYLTRTAGTYSYAGLQMGIVLPMVIVAPPTEFGSLTPAIERLEGIVIGLAASILVAGIWPRFPLRERATPPVSTG